MDSPVMPVEMDFEAARAFQVEEDAKWQAENPLADVGYRSRVTTVSTPHGAHVDVQISCPSKVRLETTKTDGALLPVLFVTHGGGWVSGSHISEESWILRPLFLPGFKDSWDVLEKFVSDPTPFVSPFEIGCHPKTLFLVGSSSGAAITAALSQECRDKGVIIVGVILNNSVLCDYRHFPSRNKISESYLQCTQIFLGSCQMATLWNTVLLLSTDGQHPRASPLLGEVHDLPSHMILVA
ncbi:hypothetical protein EJ08DRAFT_663686 [Tothia fuscella]|uniref:Alpha/beta hydrolase fold-3 domain-containing protein n=1 Tax=Tothia fuscella TaxID=1048955 RepID=A0A9P4NK77_9PEZI|nr:hypothetical protein EJ08DRAFT_663686 [Tothia fuscella]